MVVQVTVKKVEQKDHNFLTQALFLLKLKTSEFLRIKTWEGYTKEPKKAMKGSEVTSVVIWKSTFDLPGL